MSAPASCLERSNARTFGNGEEDFSPEPSLRAMRNSEVTIVARKPPDSDQVARHVEPTLRAENDVVQGGIFDIPPADTTAGSVPFDHVITNVSRDEPKAFELQFALSLPASHWPDPRR